MSFDDLRQWLSEADNLLAIAQFVAAIITALATIALWRVTKVLARETTLLAKLTARPFVVCTLESSEATSVALNLTLSNTGNATAFDIEAKVTPGLPRPGTSQATDRDPQDTVNVSLLAPSQRLPLKGVMGSQISGEIFEIEVSWALRPGKKDRETLSYKVTATDGFKAGFGVKGLHDIASELEKIRRAIK